MKLKPVNGWAWAIQTHDGTRWEMCCWVSRSKKCLLSQPKPSPEARAVRVRLSHVATFRRKVK